MPKATKLTDFFHKSCAVPADVRSSSQTSVETSDTANTTNATANTTNNTANTANEIFFLETLPQSNNNIQEPPCTLSFVDKCYQPKQGFSFPKTKVGCKYRSCQSSWFESYPWLHYDQKNDCLLCFICVTQEKKGNLRNEHCKEDTYISKGFRSWKKAPKCFNDHQASGCHNTALINHP